MVFTLPESYADYATQKEIKTAVDHILDSKSLEIPPDLDWDQLPDFHAAVLAAHQVRCEYASAIQSLWDDIWQAILYSSGLELEACTIAETREYEKGSNISFDTKYLWDNEEFYRHFCMNGYRIILGIMLKPDKARLWLWFGDESDANNRTEELLHSISDWYLDDKEGDYLYGYSKESAPISGGSIQIDQLKAAAKRALAAVRHIGEE